MNVLLVIDALNSGGAQRQIVNLAIELKRTNHNVSLLYYNNGDHYKNILSESNVPIIQLSKGGKMGMLKFLKQLHQVIKQNQFDIVCAYLFLPSLFVLMSKVIFRGKHKLILSERTFEGNVTKFHKNVTRKLYKKAYCVVPNSKHQSIQLKKFFPKNPKIEYIPNGINDQQFSYNPKIKSNEKIKVLCIGRVSQIKNTKVVIKALKLLKEQNVPYITVEWVGANFIKQDLITEYSKECITLLEESNLNENWKWGGVRKDVAEYMSQFDLLVHPSLGEGFPNVIGEGMAKGIFVIASDVFDHSLLIEPNKTGLLFNPNSEKELSETILNFINLSKESQNQMVKNAREKVVREMSVQKLGERYSNLFKQALEQ
jgi:GalNAc-alpha-(1->4)-GalNAc-alpha-(1->3)-diNAcBac-PP-undecaprenol alpha-1,4-N-acetyl-D-galactosaminyltransferase